MAATARAYPGPPKPVPPGRRRASRPCLLLRLARYVIVKTPFMPNATWVGTVQMYG
jgi:hypothetical protein